MNITSVDQQATGLSANELAWIDFLRLISGYSDPPPTLRAVQLLRRLLKRCRRQDDAPPLKVICRPEVRDTKISANLP